MPTIILYLVYGFAFVKIFKFTSATNEQTDTNGIFMSSLVTGFVILNAAYLIPLTTGNVLFDYILIALSTAIAAYALAMMYTSKTFLRILEKLHIKFTVNKYLWYDLEDEESTFVIVKYFNKNIAYYGQLSYYEEYQRFPQITLINYDIYTITPWNKIEKSMVNQRVLLDTSKADSVEFVRAKK